MERFISKKLNKNMKSAGTNDNSNAPMNMRVRSRAPST
jgi:hypothetical protein